MTRFGDDPDTADVRMAGRPTDPGHLRRLDRHARDLLAFGMRTAHPAGGARWLAADGSPDTQRPTFTWITCRMAHVYGIGALLGVSEAATIAQQALSGLTGRLHDADNGGWFPSVTDDGRAGPTKSCYDHVFVLLAASTALAASLPSAAELFDDAQQVLLDRFWDDDAGRCVDTWDTTFTRLDDYRGLNANMHAVEAMLAAAGVADDRRWIDRATRICRFVAATAESHGWRIPEHYDAAWNPLLDFNVAEPDHPFKPFGATVGHGLEWSRLFLHTEAALPSGEGSWLADAAARLFDRAVADGWAADGHPGFVYTTDWNGKVVVRDRMHWVVAEGISAAAALHRRTGDPSYADWYETWWRYADSHLIDREHGSWVHQLDATNNPTGTVWPGKPDIYHAFHAALGTRAPLYPMLASALEKHIV